MKTLSTILLTLAAFTQMTANADEILRCDGRALVLSRDKVGTPEMGHGYYSVKATFNDRGIAQYFVNAGAFAPQNFHSDWNDAFYTTGDLQTAPNGVDYTTDAYITVGNFNPRVVTNLIVFTRQGSGMHLEAFPVIGHLNGGSVMLGNRLADWNFRSCN